MTGACAMLGTARRITAKSGKRTCSPLVERVVSEMRQKDPESRFNISIPEDIGAQEVDPERFVELLRDRESPRRTGRGSLSASTRWRTPSTTPSPA